MVSKADGTVAPESVENAARAIRQGAARLSAWSQGGAQSASRLLNDLYNLYLRAGILAYLQANYEEAQQHLNTAGPARPTDGMAANFDLQKVGLFILIQSCREKQPAWRDDAVNAADAGSLQLALKLADTYLHAQRPEKAQAIYKQLLTPNSPLGTNNKTVVAYAAMQLALAYSNQSNDHEQSIQLYKRFYGKDYAGLPWAADAIMRLAVLEYNATQDPRRSIPTTSTSF